MRFRLRPYSYDLFGSLRFLVRFLRPLNGDRVGTYWNMRSNPEVGRCRSQAAPFCQTPPAWDTAQQLGIRPWVRRIGCPKSAPFRFSASAFPLSRTKAYLVSLASSVQARLNF